MYLYIIVIVYIRSVYFSQAAEIAKFARRQVNAKEQIAAKEFHAKHIKNQKTTGTKKKAVSTDNELLLVLGGTNSLSHTTVSTPTATPIVVSTMAAKKTFAHTSSAAKNIDSSSGFRDINSSLPTLPLGKPDDVVSKDKKTNNVSKNLSSSDSEDSKYCTVRENYRCQRGIYICDYMLMCIFVLCIFRRLAKSPIFIDDG